MIKFKQFITEAIQKPSKSLIKLIELVLARKLKMKLHPYPTLYRYVSVGKKKIGLRYFIGDTLTSVRFNLSGKDSVESIDIWNGTDESPTINFNVEGVDLIKLAPYLRGFIKLPRIGVHNIKLDEKFLGRPPKEETLRFVAKAGITYPHYRDNRNKFVGAVRQYKKTGEIIPLILKKGKKEVHEDDNVRENQKKIKSFDPDMLFADLQALVDSVIMGKTSSLVVTGPPGTGKSTVVMNEIKRSLSKNKWILIKGASAPFGLYEKMYRNRHKLILIDDSDSVFGDRDSVSILKAALDSEKIREVSWVSRNTVEVDETGEISPQHAEMGKIPNSFKFDGKIIFISNLSEKKINPAVLDRSLHINVAPKSADMIVRIRSMVREIYPEADLKIKQEVLDFMEGNEKSLPDTINMRSFVKAVNLRLSGSPRWQHLILKYL